ncbi:MAG: hypothetical protein ABI662_10665 [Dermatophilaceae bacterium]
MAATKKTVLPARWAVGCYDCGAETSFTGEASNVQAWIWHNEHVCHEEPHDDLAYLTLPSLDMSADQLLTWARGTASVSATWVLVYLREGDPAVGVHEPTSGPPHHLS